MFVLWAACLLLAGHAQDLCDDGTCMNSRALLQRHSHGSESTDVGDGETEMAGAPIQGSSSDSLVLASVAFAQNILKMETASCPNSSAVVISVAIMGQATLEVEDGELVAFSAQITGAGSTVYHDLQVLWEVTDGRTDLVPVLNLPDGVAWCTVLSGSTDEDLALLAKSEGHAAVQSYHAMLGYLGDSQGVNPDALVQEERASCQGSSSPPADYNLRYHPQHQNCFVKAAVNNQGGCGSCWAFAAAHVVTSRLCLKNQSDIISNADGKGRRFVSVQGVLSCSSSKRGCSGGWMTNAYHEWKRGGAVLARDYTYQPSKSKFPWHRTGASCEWGDYVKPYRVSSYYNVPRSAKAMQQEILCEGPIAVAFWVYSSFFRYRSGVYTGPLSGGKKGGHAVVAVGWGALSGTDYWEIMNSWGNGWGDGGYVKFQRGNNLCSIESWGLQAAKVETTEASWIYKNWGSCSNQGGRSLKSRGIKCVDNAGSSATAASKCPVDGGWPNQASFPASTSRVPAEMEPSAIAVCSNGGTCDKAFCNGNGAASGANGACSCSCNKGFAGSRCEQCARTHQGFPNCRESCTRAADCSGRGTASGVKWKNEFGADLNSCSCRCDAGSSGAKCQNGSSPIPSPTPSPTPTPNPSPTPLPGPSIVACDFETGYCGWTTDKDQRKKDAWRIGTSTSSGGTGPQKGDHTPGNGMKFVYLEASSPNYPRKTFKLTSPRFNASATFWFVFWYNMNGRAMGTLTLESYDGSAWSQQPLWTMQGDKGDIWLQGSVQLPAGTTQLRFKGTTANSYTSDFALDDLSISMAPPPTPTTTTTTPGCYLPQTRYNPLNMQGQGRTVAQSAADCQQRCATVSGCSHFSWWPNGGCHIQDASASSKSDGVAVAGPNTICPTRTKAECVSACASSSYTCSRHSGCQRPSCQLGCEIAFSSRHQAGCKAVCKHAQGKCSYKPLGFRSSASLCTARTCPGGQFNGNCESAGGCEHACDFMFSVANTTTLPPTTQPPSTQAPTTLPPTTQAPTTLPPATTQLPLSTQAPTTLPPATTQPPTPVTTTTTTIIAVVSGKVPAGSSQMPVASVSGIQAGDLLTLNKTSLLEVSLDFGHDGNTYEVLKVIVGSDGVGGALELDRQLTQDVDKGTKIIVSPPPPSTSTTTTNTGDIVIPIVVNTSKTDSVDIKVSLTK